MENSNVITPLLNNEEMVKMNQEEYERRLEIENYQIELSEADFWDGDSSVFY